MNFRKYWILLFWILLSGFNFPNEKKFLSQKAENISVFDSKGNVFDLFSLLGNKPLVISPVYTKCPSVCGIISNGVQTVVNKLGTLGKDFNIVSFSFDSSDKKEDLAFYESRWKMDGLHWKTISAKADQIKKLMQSFDYQFEYDSTNKE